MQLIKLADKLGHRRIHSGGSDSSTGSVGGSDLTGDEIYERAEDYSNQLMEARMF